VGWLFSFVMIFMIPIDLHYSYNHYPKTSEEEKKGWLVMSYSNSVLNYLCYPYLIAYIASPAFTRCGKLKNAIRRNMLIYLLYLVAGIAVGMTIYFSETVRE
jgi:hypothetical protein